MIYKERTESINIKIMKSQDARMDLNKTERQYFLNQIKGYEGELLFDSFTKNLVCDCLILNDLLLQFNNTTFQIDSLLVTAEVLYLFEVKNYEGDFYYEADRLYKKPKIERNNPLIQLHRSESLLRQLLQSLGFTIPIEAYVVFVNPGFTLYQAPLHKQIIFPTQIISFFQNLNKSNAKINNKHKVLAEKLVSMHMQESPYGQLLEYTYEQLRKGICCVECRSLTVEIVGRNCVCSRCGHEELVNDAVLRSTDELKLLFPENKITTNLVLEWCCVVESKKRIQRILDKNYQIVRNNRWTYYE
ncbi:NERD domain-containing protein [Bacillus timonensis]|uniref:NERD domain-containing protein n=1 Tax=Bacillus timonensis TaxID=1033734 RepID=A0A4S3PQE3_9BACI|nr:nuclease-related domain-containing protein [Bacillus timonensis]THE11718.1 NERD domain-containing protein [Bacillus timonensis]